MFLGFSEHEQGPSSSIQFEVKPMLSSTTREAEPSHSILFGPDAAILEVPGPPYLCIGAGYDCPDCTMLVKR